MKKPIYGYVKGGTHPKMKGMLRQEQAPIVAKMFTLTNLEWFEDRKVDELSGGERQGMALARTLAPDPGCLCWTSP